MSKLTRTTTTTRIIVIIGLAATLVGSTIALSASNHSASAQGLTSSLKQKASSMLSGGANKTGIGNMTKSGSNSTGSSLKQKASGILGSITGK
jgi:hypothetical protein